MRSLPRRRVFLLFLLAVTIVLSTLILLPRIGALPEGLLSAHFEDIKRLRPDEASLRAMDKIGYRYPRGESYFDILSRLVPLVHEMESYHEPLLIVSHQATLRILYSYLMGLPRKDAPKVEIPLHNLIKITWDGWRNISEERIPFEGGTKNLQNDGQTNL